VESLLGGGEALEDERLDGVGRLVRKRLGRMAPRPDVLRGERRELARLNTDEVDTSNTDEVDASAFGGPRLLQRDLVRMFSRSRLSLGFATAGDSHLAAKRLTHLRLREFEAPMSGALYLTEDQPELAEYFTPGEEVLTYTDPDDLLDKARYYLAHQEKAERIRRAGLERARREHTWQHRFSELFAALDLPAT